MDYDALLQTIFKNTDHTIESIAEILDLEVNQLLDNKVYNEKRINKLRMLSEFIDHYGLYTHHN